MTAPAEDRKRPAGGDVATGVPSDATAVLSGLVRQVAACHANGELHLHVAPEHLTETDDGRWAFRPLSEERNVTVSPSRLPPEFSGADDLVLPRDLPAAEERLRSKGDPRRIDLFGLGRVACWLFADATEQEYLRSPAAAARVPAALRPVIDGLLGHDASRRYVSCDAVLVDLIEQDESLHAHSDTPRHGTGVDHHRDTPRPPAAPPEGDLPFSKLGHYEVRRRLGGGGMGDVYEAYDPTLDRRVAIKVLPPDLARYQDYVNRFKSEAQAVAKLSHPNLVPIHFIGSDGPTHYFAMRLVEGPSLAELLSDRGSLGQEEALELVCQIVAGLREAHRSGLIHRDIKPGNVLIDTERGTAMLADFGLVKSLGASAAMTATGVVMGTVDYIAPEQGRGKAVDERSDLYSIGVLLYQMLSGRLPFHAESATAMIFQHAYEAPPSLAETAPGVCDDLVRIVARLMEKDPANRHVSADELLGDLNAVDPDRAGGRAAEGWNASTRSPLEGRHDRAAATKPFFAPRPLGWRRRLLALFNRHAPEQLRELQNTQLQVDGGIAVYEERREKLVALANESTDIERELEQQIAASEASESDDHDQLSEQLAQQHEESAALQKQLAEVDAVLARLRSERDVLVARLRVAKARDSGHAASDQSKRSVVFVAALTLAACLSVVTAVYWSWKSSKPLATAPARQEPLPLDLVEPLILNSADVFLSNDWRWSDPELITGAIHEDPMLSADFPRVSQDGLSMLFTSDRSGGEGGTDLWESSRPTPDSPWGEPKNLGPNINSEGYDGAGSMTADGKLLVFEHRETADGQSDLYISRRSSPKAPWSLRIPIDQMINSPAGEYAPAISADGLELYFTRKSSGITKGRGGHDVWVSRRVSRKASWSKPVNLEGQINTAAHDYHPSVSSDKRAILFSSGRKGSHDLFVSLRGDPGRRFSTTQNLGTIVNSDFGEEAPFLSADSRTLWFRSDRPVAGVKKRRIWVSHGKMIASSRAGSVLAESLTSDASRWSEPRLVAGGIHADPGDDADSPWVSEDKQTMLFTSRRGDKEDSDLWIATRPTADAPWGEPERLPPPINTEGYEGSASLAVDGGLELLFFERRPKEGGKLGDADIYFTFRSVLNNTWREPAPLIATRTEGNEYNPFITPDGLELYYGSDRSGGWGRRDVWVVRRESTNLPWSEPINLGPPVNTAGDQFHPRVVGDGNAMLFSSDRKKGNLWKDIWVATRPRATSSFTSRIRLGGSFNQWEAHKGGAFLSADGETLWFQSEQPVEGVRRRRLWVTQKLAATSPLPLPAEAIAALTSSDHEWTEPENLGKRINDRGADGDPWVSADGLTLLYNSTRTGGGDILMARRASPADAWGEPVNLGANINAPDAWDSSASMSDDRLVLALGSYRKGGRGNSDIYLTQRDSVNAPWPKVVNLGAPINTEHGEWAPMISPDGLTLYFSSTRPGGVGFVDNWMASRKSRWAPWEKPVNLGIWINSPQADWSPSVFAGGRVLVFNSERPGGKGKSDLYLSTRAEVSDPWDLPRSLGPRVNSAEGDGSGFLSADGKTLWFSSGREGSLGDGDLWVSRLVKKK